ncbi:hypothetical protein Ppa06_39630 [Planomonospora parontospora subsp. parontospora]|uniref:Uncharacterized protein n=2 Tax=Planomonospora parontospora TaxID=58119 RepID=A0AA37BIJ7_9ACTN|nr:hypothetical protein GCM10010126_39290 [Planomonospora parontospora]GII10165.1 hypothetical protein Ppa06_39630 [Planomonospora parontospora subsp. parontospora]
MAVSTAGIAFRPSRWKLGPVDALTMSPVPGKRPMTLREFIERAREDLRGDGPQGSGPGPARITAP